jgi:Lrp/AsnC family leucine-responsive transcriptional regulator/Lrp/AsnC family transcriptional regulator
VEINNPRMLGFDTVVIVRIKLSGHDSENLEKFKKAVSRIPEIQVALLVLGDFDYYLRLVCEDIYHYQRVLQDKLVDLPGVREMHSSVVLQIIKDSSALPL